MPGQVPAREKDRRWRRLMALQKEIAADVSSRAVGRTIKVLVEEPGVARGEADAPDIDGRVYVPLDLAVGEFSQVTITRSRDYDLLALPEGEEPAAFKTARMAS
jgi:ribosomal protein S12 methylthiotransferase